MGRFVSNKLMALSTIINVICESNCIENQNFWASGASRNACTLPPLGKPTVSISRKKILCKEAVFERTGTNTWPLQCAQTSFFKGRNGQWSKESKLKHWHFRTIPLFVVKLMDSADTDTTALSKWMMFYLWFFQDWNFLTHSRSFGCFTSPSFFWKKTPIYIIIYLYIYIYIHLPAICRDWMWVDSWGSRSPHLCA